MIFCTLRILSEYRPRRSSTCTSSSRRRNSSRSPTLCSTLKRTSCRDSSRRNSRLAGRAGNVRLSKSSIYCGGLSCLRYLRPTSINTKSRQGKCIMQIVFSFLGDCISKKLNPKIPGSALPMNRARATSRSFAHPEKGTQPINPKPRKSQQEKSQNPPNNKPNSTAPPRPSVSENNTRTGRYDHAALIAFSEHVLTFS